jgi:hypothetical protein
MLSHLDEPGAECQPPDLVQLQPVVLTAADRGGELARGRVLDALDARTVQRDPELVGLDLERHHRRDQVVDVGRAGDQDREGPVPVVVPAPAPARSADLAPLCEGAESPLGEDLGGLAHDHETHPEDRFREPPHRVEEGPEVELVRGGEPMEARSHRLVRVLEDAQPGLAAAAKDRRIGPVVDLDGVDERGLLGRRLRSRQA